ncbi:hypothetical protein C8F01DRAFT_1091837 [Mycena amicta]|nr:hypothetical protein C8F01DRAFT_1091837 [Mycena amicta]
MPPSPFVPGWTKAVFSTASSVFSLRLWVHWSGGCRQLSDSLSSSKLFPPPDSLLDSLGNPVGASDAYTRLFTLFIRIWVYFVQQAVDPEFVLPTEFAPPTPGSESGLRRGLGLLILSLDDFHLRYRICAHEAIQRELTPPRFIPAESRNTFRILLHILRHAYQPIFHGESPDYGITLVQDFLARAEADAIARPNAARDFLMCRSIFFMAGVVPLHSYLGDDLILKIAELLPGPDLIAPPLVPGTFSLDILFAFSLRPAIHSLHAFVINSFFRLFSFRPVSEAELVRIRQAVQALADVLWAVFVGWSSLCMVHGGHVNPDRWPDVVIPAQAASMLRIFESILDHFGYYLPDGTESSEMTAQHVDIGSVDSLEEYLHRPGVVLYCREVLIPLRDIILVLDQHVTLSEAPMASPSWVRHRTAMFILLLSHVQDYVEPLRGAAPGSRVPTPSYAALDFIGKVILRYGLEGDHVLGVRLAADATLRSVIGHVSDVAWGMSARHAEISRTRASRSPLKAVSLDSEIAEYRPVDALAAPSEQLMRVIIERARVNPLASSYVNSPDGLGRFFQDFYRPLATALNNAFPGSAAFPTDVPVATREAMITFVGKLFEWSIIAYQICTQIAVYAQTPLSAPSEIIFSLRLTQKFHLLCGCPNYGGSRGQEQEKHRCISHLTRLGRVLHPPIPLITSNETTRMFLISEKNAPAVGEIKLLEERCRVRNVLGMAKENFCISHLLAFMKQLKKESHIKSHQELFGSSICRKA